MSFPRHAKYMDSGVDWLSQIPSHWAVKRLRFVAELNPSKSEVSHLAADTEVSFLPMEAIGEDGSLELDRVRPLADVQTGYTFFRDGDVTIAKITPCFENGKGAAMRDLCNGIGFGTTELIVTRPKATQTTSTYLHWLFTSRPFRKAGEAFMYGAGGQKRVPDDFVRDFAIGFPPLPEQRHIVTFLDREAAKIDALVEEQRRLIELLKEKRQAVISQAVTKGLNPNVQMKDSDVEWFGKVPTHWEVKSIKHCCMTTSGGTPNTAQQEAYYTDETGIPWIRTMDLTNELLTSVEVYITEQALQDTACKVLPPGTVMVAMYGGDGTVGKNGLLGIPAAINQAVCGLLPSHSVVPEFLFRYIQFFRPFWMVGAESSRKDPNISQERVRNAPVLLPPMAEQLAIVEFLRLESDRFEALSAEAQRAVELLQERRAALISAAVTGKIDVRGLAPQREAVAA